MPDRTEAILGSEGEREAVFQRLLADARLLEGAGCTVIAVPCNTSHFFLDRVQEQVGVPILHMIRETARLLASQGLKRPGILATDGTIQSGLYQKEFEAVGIQATVPTPPAPEAGHVPDLRRCEVRSGRGPPEVRRHPPGPGGTGLRLRACWPAPSCPSLPTGTTCLPSTQTPWPSWPSGRSGLPCKPLRHIFIK